MPDVTSADQDRRLSQALESEDVIGALRVREQLLTGILGSLGTVVTLDADWRCTFANDAAARMAGVSPEELVGRDVHDLAPLEHAAVLAHLERAMAEHRSVEFEVQDAQQRTYHARAVPLADGGLAVHVRDFTRQELAETAKAAAEERYEELVQSVNSAILRWRRDGTLTFFNEYAEQLFGWRAEEVLGRNVGLLIPHASADEGDVSSLIEDIVAHPERYASNVNENVRKDGSRLWMAWTNRALLDERGEVTEVFAVGNDVSELVNAQTALRESQRRLLIAQDAAALGVYDYDPVSGSLEWDDRVREIWGVGPDEPVTLETFFGGLHADDREPTRAAVEGLLDPAGEDRYRTSYRVLNRADGTVRWVETAGMVLVHEGRAVRLVGTVEDVTRRKLLEEALREREDAAVAQAERSRLARDLHDSVTQALFAATMKAEALTLAADALPERSLAAIEEVRRLNRGALAQMRTLLLELRGDPLEEVPIQQLLRQLVEAAESRAKVNVMLTMRGEANLPPALHVSLYRIAQEALNNVTRHAGASKAWVDLDLGPGRARLRVGDDGCGFDPALVGPGQLGLRSMRERAAEAGAELRVAARVGGGTFVTLDWHED